MSHHPKPEKIDLSSDEFKALEDDIKASNLSAANTDLVIKSLQFMVWLQGSLEHAKITVKKLQNLFGILPFKPCKKSKATAKKAQENAGSTVILSDDSNCSTTTVDDDTNNQQRKGGSGRVPADAYIHAEVVTINHAEFKAGDLCPAACGGKLYALKPSAVIKIEGSSFAKTTRYDIERLRCALCGELQKAESIITKDKYAQSFVAHLIMHKYFLAIPFYRLEAYQDTLHMPLPDATQWHLVNEGYAKLLPLFKALALYASNAHRYHYDDTRVRILSVMKDNRSKTSKERTGQYTTVISADTKEGAITLFYSSTQHAGENMTALLAPRDDHAGQCVTMCDALSANKLDHTDVIESNCLSHALVKFMDLESVSPYDLSRPINDLVQVFDHDKKTKGMTDQQRLHYHKKHSKPIINKLQKWMQLQLKDHHVEPNSHLGKILQYCLKHWHKLTCFLRVAGCPISNNRAERLLKIIIRLRKNAMFHATEHGAEVAATMLSLIQTAIDQQINPIDYLHYLLVHADQVAEKPEQFLPWALPENFQATLKQAA